MARLKLTSDLESIVDFCDVGVRMPRRQRRGGGGNRQRMRRFAGEVKRDEVWYLRNATFAVAEGESVAIVGHRGSGRDELLRLAAATLIPDTGLVRRRVPVVPIVGLGGTLNRDLTIRQNVYVIGGLLGMTVDEVRERLPRIIATAGVEKLVDKYVADAPGPVRGRLAWSIAMATDARAFAIAQALVVGDPGFRRECWKIVESKRASGVSFLIYSDRGSDLERFCDRAILLDAGTIVAQTTVQDALARLRLIKPPTGHAHIVLDDETFEDDDDVL